MIADSSDSHAFQWFESELPISVSGGTSMPTAKRWMALSRIAMTLSSRSDQNVRCLIASMYSPGAVTTIGTNVAGVPGAAFAASIASARICMNVLACVASGSDSCWAEN